MAFAKVKSAQTYLLDGHIIDVEVDISKGLHSFTIVGLPDKAIEEAKDRVSAAIKNSGFQSPKSHNQKIVIALAPAHIKKEGVCFDVAIALGYLLANGDIVCELENKIFLGELSLDGLVRPISGVLPLVDRAKRSGFLEVYVPKENAEEAALIRGIKIFPVNSLSELIEHLVNKNEEKRIAENEPTELPETENIGIIDISEVKGQESGKRGLLIAASGGHNVALSGPAGTGKTMLARALQSILPPLTFDEVLEVTGIHSIARALNSPVISHPPFRSPHHTSSYVALVGGGAMPRPGEITLAHRGVLFLDEFPEFDRRVIEALRQPLEEKVVTVARSKGVGNFPAQFILVAAMNPCPCGNFGTTRTCKCSPIAIERYHKKMSGPIADRLDLFIDMPLVEYSTLSEKNSNIKDTSKTFKERVLRARTFAKNRFEKAGKNYATNSEIKPKDMETLIPLDDKLKNLLNTAAQKMELSPRAYHKIMRVARTIADLDESENVGEKHLLEALQFRKKN